MFVESLKKAWESTQLKSIVCKEFRKTILNWQEECPEEAFGICDDEFNDEGLVLNSLSVSESHQNDYRFKIEAEYFKIFSNNIKVIYIIKFWDDLTIYDDVFYTEARNS